MQINWTKLEHDGLTPCWEGRTAADEDALFNIEGADDSGHFELSGALMPLESHAAFKTLAEAQAAAAESLAGWCRKNGLVEANDFTSTGTFPVQRITNGFLVTWEPKRQVFYKDEEDLGKALTIDLAHFFRDARLHDWDGRAVLRFAISLAD